MTTFEENNIIVRLELLVREYQSLQGDSFEKQNIFAKLYRSTYGLLKQKVNCFLCGINSKHKKSKTPESYYMLYTGEDIEDILIDVYMRIAQNLHTLQKPGSFLSWAYMICENITMNYMIKIVRREKIAKVRSTNDLTFDYSDDNSYDYVNTLSAEQFGYIACISANIEHEDASRVMADIISQLTAAQQSCISLWLEGLSFSEIGSRLDIKETTVKTHIHRAKKKILTLIEELNEDDRAALYDEYHSFGTVPRICLSEMTEGYNRLTDKLYNDGVWETQADNGVATVISKRHDNHFKFIVMSGTAILVLLSVFVILISNSLAVNSAVSASEAYQRYMEEAIGHKNSELINLDDAKEIDVDQIITVNRRSDVTYKFTADSSEEKYCMAITDREGTTTYNVGDYNSEGNPTVYVRYYDSDKKRISSYSMEKGKEYYVFVENVGNSSAQIKLSEGVSSGNCGGISWTLDDDGTLNLSGGGTVPNGLFQYDSRIIGFLVSGDISGFGEEAFMGCSNLVGTEDLTPEDEAGLLKDKIVEKVEAGQLTLDEIESFTDRNLTDDCSEYRDNVIEDSLYNILTDEMAEKNLDYDNKKVLKKYVEDNLPDSLKKYISVIISYD